MNTKIFSLVAAGTIWLLVAIRIGNRAFEWLSPYFNPPQWQLALLIVSLALGLVKSRSVLKKAALRNISHISKVGDSIQYYFYGWILLYGIHGCITISLMIALGYGLRALRANGCDPYNLFGFIYLAVALGLALASRYYFEAAAEQKAKISESQS